MPKYKFCVCSLFLIQMTASAENLSLNDALERAYLKSPSLESVHLEAEAVEKSLDLASLRPNPELEIEAEGIQEDDLSPSEYSFKISQSFLMGGKLEKAAEVAQKESAQYLWLREELRLEINQNVRKAFVDVLAAQARKNLSEEDRKLSVELLQKIEERIEYGAASKLDLFPAKLAVESLKISQKQIDSDLEVARFALASELNLSIDELPKVEGDFFAIDNPENFELSENHPSLLKFDSQAALFRAQAELAKAEDSADITISAGLKHDVESEENSMMLSASIPLNFSKRGQIEYVKSNLHAESAMASKSNARRLLQQELDELVVKYAAIYSRYSETESQLIPLAESALDYCLDAFEKGQISTLQIIDAQKNLLELKAQQIETIRDAHLLRAQLTKFTQEGL